ncbi:hypothetical protein SUDANB38_03210 [Streptomyces sp. enrichment culture]
MTEHNGPDGPSNHRTGNDAVNTPEPSASRPAPGEEPGTQAEQGAASETTPAAPSPADPSPAGDAQRDDEPALDDAQPDAAPQPDEPQPDATGSDSTQPDSTPSDSTQSDAVPQTDAARSEAARSDSAQPDAVRSEAGPRQESAASAQPDSTPHGHSTPPSAFSAPASTAPAFSGSASSDGPDVFDLGSGLGAEGLGGDELALRRLLQGAVEDLEPSPGALDHLRRAVPARRARKRQALVGAAAAVILLGTGVPAFVHVAASDTAAEANPVNAGHGEQVQGGTGDAQGPAGEEAAGSPSGELNGSGKDGANPSGTPTSAGTSASDGADGAPDRATSAPATVPLCEAGQLGVSLAETSGPTGDGTVYGTFRIANVSSSDCAVTASGTVGFGTSGAADPGRISVVRHTAGDAASGLPDPSATVGSLVLKPSGAYDVKFAWVPSETCPANGGGGSGDGGGGSSGGGGEQSPTPTAPSTPTEEPPPPTAGATTGTAEGGTDTDAGTAVEPQMLPAEDTADGSVTVTHTPGAGGPQAAVTIPNACAGTIYRTGLLPA